MADVDPAAFEHSIAVRQLRPEDFDAVIAVQQRCFPGMPTWQRDQFESQIRHFPEGQLCVEYDGRIVASSSSLIVDFGEYSEWHNWRKIADGGYIRNHDPHGDTLYGIEIMVDPEFRGRKLARRLYDVRKDICRDRNLARIVIAGRIPGYGKHADAMSAREYVQRVLDKTLVDPVLTAQLANGFVLKGLIPNYLPSDSESRGFATFLEWANLDHVPHEVRQYRRVIGVRVTVVQYLMRTISSFEEFAKQCEYFIDVASDYKSDFVLFPELFTNQLLSFIAKTRPGLAARCVAEFTSQYLELFGGLAVKYNVNIIGGSHFTVEHDNLYNIAYLFRRDGSIDRQFKLHVTPNERRWWGVQAGNRMEVLDTDCGPISIQICYDVEFPELTRIAIDRGAQLIFVPFNTDTRQAYLRVRTCAQARCIENHVYAVLSGCVGNLPFVENVDIHYAQSGIYTPSDFSFARDGIAAECTPNIETLVIQDVDIELLRDHRSSGSVQNWNDRRRDLYHLVYREEDRTHSI